MATKTEEEVVVKAPAVPVSVAAAAAEAAEAYDITDIEAQAKAVAKAWEAKLKEQTRAYQKQVAAKAKDSTEATIAAGAPNWWNLILAGPWQAGGPGPFTPNKVLAADQGGFFLAAIWRNPVGVPSPANVMSAYMYQVRLYTMNITTVAAGPAFVQPAAPAMFGVGSINVHSFPFGAGAFGTPAQTSPHLLEVNAVVDVVGPAVGWPAFAGYSTWVWDPDAEAPFLTIPGVAAHLQFERPARFLVYA